ncbi:MAG TPA: EAL domain-containing protein [Candidatus Dormibacteraeota bacterium]
MSEPPARDERTPRTVVLVGGSAPFASLIEGVIRTGSAGRTRFAHAPAPDDVVARDLDGTCVLVHLGRRSSGLTQLDAVLNIATRASIVAVTESDDDERGLLALQRGAHESITAMDSTSEQLMRALRAAHERRRSAMQREVEDAFVAESASLVREILDSLGMMAVAIDGHGTVFRVNQPWREGRPLGDGCDVGDNYLDACAELAAQEAPELAAVAAGVRAVLDRSAGRYERDCRRSDGRTLRIVALPLLARHGAVVSHTFVPARRLPPPLAHTAVIAPSASARASDSIEVVTPELGGDLLALRGEIERALNDDELSLAFQPIVDARSGRILGAEALLRWRRLGGHWVSPAQVIAATEESGLIGRLGRWVLNTACARLTELERRLGGGRRLGMSINLSGAQLADPRLPEDVADAVGSRGCDPTAVCLEVTETAIAEDMVAAAANLEVLRRYGVSIALDDFGTGYSSLQYAKLFKVNIVKIDKIFVQELGRGGPDRVIVASVVALAHGLGARVIAEGVETEEQRRLLGALDCDALQGFLLSRPIDFEAFVRLCEAEQRWWRELLPARA